MPPLLESHHAIAGTLGQNTASEELLRRRKAEQLARKYENQHTIFRHRTVTIVHEEILPPLLTPQQWEYENSAIVEYMTPEVLAFSKRDMEPRIVRTRQDMTSSIQYGNVNQVVFRGDTREPSLIFSTGFARKDLSKEVRLGSEKTYGGISTSTSADVVRRKYGNCREYIYACWVGRAIDTQDFNKLDEVIALHIEPRHVIAGAGPISKPSCDDKFASFRMGVGEIRENMACNVPNTERQRGFQILQSMCYMLGPKTAKGAWEV